ncbi:Tetraspanin-CD63 receptor [Schistosoma japonicum]|nr:Tetraspanin-CD63 receptor [Schistosoma japonicum]KAH8856803.1 Tetraspanin-CD63 receptor [Schistosoma japonicum]
MSCCGSAVLIIINIVFITFGFLLIIGGIIAVRFQRETIDKIINLINTMLKHLGNESQQEAINNYIRNIFKFGSPIGTAIVIIGIGCVIISLFGICGVCMNNKKLLGIYAFFVGILAVAMLLTLALYYYQRKVLIETGLDLFRNSLKNYKSMASLTPDNVLAVFVSISLNCCGENGGDDFKNAINFTGNDALNDQTYTNIKYPLVCCKFNPQINFVDPECPRGFTITNSNINRGCKVELEEAFSQYSYIVVIALTSGSVLQMAIFSLTVAKIRSIRD